MTQLRMRGPGLKHRAFFEALAEHEEGSADARAATAGLLVMRLLDHWLLAGPVMVEPESMSIRSSREAIMAMDEHDAARPVLLGLVNAMQTTRDVDMHPVLPRVFAYAGVLESRGALAMAADAYETVIDLNDDDEGRAMVVDSLLRVGFCRRMLGTLAESDVAFVEAAKLAKRMRDVPRLRRAEIGQANVMIMKGNLPKAEKSLRGIGEACEKAGLQAEFAVVLHTRAVVAQRRGNVDEAISLAYESLQRTELLSERDRVLADLAAFFISAERYDGARDALLLLDATAQTQNVRMSARVNMVALAARVDDRATFDRARALADECSLPLEAKVNYLIESARGLRRFGEYERAKELLTEAKAKSSEHGLNRSLFEIEQLLDEETLVATTKNGEAHHIEEDPTAFIALELKKMYLKLPA